MNVEYTWILIQEGKLSTFRLLFILSFIGQFFHPVGKGRSLFKPATSFALLENIIIWFKIQVIIHPFLQNKKNETRMTTSIKAKLCILLDKQTNSPKYRVIWI